MCTDMYYFIFFKKLISEIILNRTIYNPPINKKFLFLFIY